MHCRLKELENYYWRTPVLNKTIKVSNFLVRHLCILKILGEALLEPPSQILPAKATAISSWSASHSAAAPTPASCRLPNSTSPPPIPEAGEGCRKRLRVASCRRTYQPLVTTNRHRKLVTSSAQEHDAGEAKSIPLLFAFCCARSANPNR